MESKLAGTAALVTGASSGIGAGGSGDGADGGEQHRLQQQ
jgi:NAD(P)-dependent dehydrogenase (short-subunit alcohol dehydrogenase family)